MVEFSDDETSVFDEVMQVLKEQLSFESVRLCDETIITLPGLEIYLGRRKVYCDRREIKLTTKEYELLYLLAVNKGHVLTYGQIYDKIWGMDGMGDERNSVGCHIRNLRYKIHAVAPNILITIRCVREIGYRLDITGSEHNSK